MEWSPSHTATEYVSQQIHNFSKTAFASLQQKRLISCACWFKLFRYSIGHALCYMYFLLLYATVMYQLQTVFVCFSFSFLFSLFLTIVVILFFFFFHSFVIFLPYTWNDLSHRRPALMVLTFPAAYHNRNVIFFSLQCILLCCG